MARETVVILGGGIIGCSLAEELARRGRRVVVVERRHVGAEASTAAAGILASQMDLSQPGPLFELCQEARRMYPRWVRHLEARSGMSVGYHRDGLLYLAMSASTERAMDRQAAWQTKARVAIERWSPRELRRREPAVDGRIRRGFFFPMEAQVDNARLMQALARACRRAGVQLLEQTAARRVLIRGGAAQGVETTRGRIRASVVVNCLGSWSPALGPVLPIQPVRGQILVFQGPRRLLRHALFSEEAYVVQRRDGRLICGSTLEFAGFEKTLTIQGIHKIVSGLRHFSQKLDRCRLIDAWAGFRPYVPDMKPILGATAVDRLYVATGHYRHGILLAPVTAAHMADVVTGARSAFDLTPFSPSRF